AQALAAEIGKRDKDMLKGVSDNFLRGKSSLLSPASNFNASQLVAGWKSVDPERKLTSNLNFKHDGTFTGNLEFDGQSNGDFSGKWKLKDGTLNYEYTASLNQNIPVGMIEHDRMIELTKDQYTVENAVGARESFVRVQ